MVGFWKKFNRFGHKVVPSKSLKSQMTSNVKQTVLKTVENIVNTNVNTDGENVKIPKNSDSNPWKNLVIPELCPYSRMGKPFSDVLNVFEKNYDTQKIIKRLKDGDEFNMMFRLKRCNQNQQNERDSWKIRAESKNKILNTFKPYVEVGDEQKLGFKFQPENIKKYIISGDIGIHQKFSDNRNISSTFYASAQYKHPATVIGAKYELSQYDQQQLKLCSLEISPVFGRTFNNVGVLAGLNFKLNNSQNFSLTNVCRAASIGIVFPSTAGRLTIHPNDNECVVDGYWKVNEKLEVATSLKSHIRNPEWMRNNQEIGVKYKYSDGMTYLFKTDLAGSLSAGLWLKQKLFNLGICLQSDIQNRDYTRKVGVSLEF